jgi:hypothetical protein
MRASRLNAGSLSLHVSSERSLYPETVAELFCNGTPPAPGVGDDAQAEIFFIENEAAPRSRIAVPPDGMVILDSPSGKQIHTEALTVEAFLTAMPPRFIVHVRRPAMAEYELKVHITVVLFKLLFFLERLALHAAAVRLHGVVNLFFGAKGAGKSSTSLYLARSGGTVLAEDRLVLRRSGGRFLVSGSGERFRVTAKTERHFFSAPLDAEIRDVGGVLKKEFPVDRFFSAAPHVDFPVDRIFFNRVDAKFAIRPLSRHEALLELIRETKASLRFAGAEDYRTYLDYLRGFAETTRAFRLELSPDLSDLEQLGSFLAADGD